MTGRERALAAARGGATDRRPTVGWSSDADVVIGPAAGEDQMRLAECLNPFAMARKEGVDLNQALADDPAAGNELLDQFVARTREALAAGLDSGADGVLYRLHGAREALCTPMQYGGYYLERDRELLEEIGEAALNVLLVVGEDAYLDFVCDLPAHVFAWDADATGVTSDQIRALRVGAQASTDEASEFRLGPIPSTIAD